MRRRPDTLLPIEASILAAGIDLRGRGVEEFHGFFIAKEIREREEARLLTAHGTLYKALDRLEKAGLLVSRWEDALIAAGENRPRRRLYRVTGAGERALARVETARLGAVPRLEGGLSHSREEPLMSLTVALTRSWVRLYTRGVRPDLRDRRRAEIESDLWEQEHDAAEAGRWSGRTGLEMLGRLMLGVPSDLSWRLEHGGARRGRRDPRSSIIEGGRNVGAAVRQHWLASGRLGSLAPYSPWGPWPEPP